MPPCPEQFETRGWRGNPRTTAADAAEVMGEAVARGGKREGLKLTPGRPCKVHRLEIG